MVPAAEHVGKRHEQRVGPAPSRAVYNQALAREKAPASRHRTLFPFVVAPSMRPANFLTSGALAFCKHATMCERHLDHAHAWRWVGCRVGWCDHHHPRPENSGQVGREQRGVFEVCCGGVTSLWRSAFAHTYAQTYESLMLLPNPAPGALPFLMWGRIVFLQCVDGVLWGAGSRSAQGPLRGLTQRKCGGLGARRSIFAAPHTLLHSGGRHMHSHAYASQARAPLSLAPPRLPACSLWVCGQSAARCVELLGPALFAAPSSASLVQSATLKLTNPALCNH